MPNKKKLPDSRPLVPPNVVEPLVDAEEMTVALGVDTDAMEAYRELRKPHVNYADLVGLVSIGVPNQETTVNVPTTSAGILAKKYVPIVALYNMVEWHILEAYKKMQGGTRCTVKHLQDLIRAQKEVTELLTEAAGFMDYSGKRPSPKSAIGTIFAGVVNISNEITGKQDEDLELGDVLKHLESLTARAKTAEPKDLIEAQKSEITEDPDFNEKYPELVNEDGTLKKIGKDKDSDD